ncbi:putative nucleotidyltransferase, ribonuclease H [Tanacetum coccineum]
MTYSRVQIHTINKGLIKKDIRVNVKGKVHEVSVVEEIRDITCVDIQDVCGRGEDRDKYRDSNNEEGDSCDEGGVNGREEDDVRNNGPGDDSGDSKMKTAEEVEKSYENYKEKDNGSKNNEDVGNINKVEIKHEDNNINLKAVTGERVFFYWIMGLLKENNEGNENNKYQEHWNLEFRREKREVLPSSLMGSRGTKSKKKRKSSADMIFDEAYVKEKLKEARSRQKSYADKHQRDLEFQVGDRVFLKVSPFRGVKRFGIKGKLSPRFIGPFEILERIGEVSYRLALPPQLSHVHDVFHVSLLRGYHYHPLHVASYPFDQIQPDMSLSEEPESILDRQERVMRNKVIPFVKILWKNHPEREATWETEESMRASYPHFFV